MYEINEDSEILFKNSRIILKENIVENVVIIQGVLYNWVQTKLQKIFLSFNFFSKINNTRGCGRIMEFKWNTL